MIFLFVLILIIKLPPIYLLPFSNPSSILTSHAFVKIIIWLYAGLIFFYKKGAVLKKLKKHGQAFILLLFYFITQVLSIIKANNVSSYLISFTNIYSYISIYFLAFYFTNYEFDKNKIRTLLKSALIIIVSFEMLLFTMNYFNILPVFFLQKEIVNAYLTDTARNRYWFIINSEAFIPLAFFYLVDKKRLNKKYLVPLVLLISFSLLSNIRTRLVQNIFAIFTSLILILIVGGFKNKKTAFNLVIGIIIFFFLILNMVTSINSYNIISRLNLENENLSTIISRKEFASLSIDYFKSSPIFGIGLGNYTNQKILNDKFNTFSIQKNQQEYHLAVADSPHNIFFEILSESGILGIISILILLVYFIIRDIRFFKFKKSTLTSYLILSSWTNFIYTLFNPYNTIYIFGWFWFMRGIIEANYE